MPWRGTRTLTFEGLYIEGNVYRIVCLHTCHHESQQTTTDTITMSVLDKCPSQAVDSSDCSSLPMPPRKPAGMCPQAAQHESLWWRPTVSGRPILHHPTRRPPRSRSPRGPPAAGEGPLQDRAMCIGSLVLELPCQSAACQVQRSPKWQHQDSLQMQRSEAIGLSALVAEASIQSVVRLRCSDLLEGACIRSQQFK